MDLDYLNENDDSNSVAVNELDIRNFSELRSAQYTVEKNESEAGAVFVESKKYGKIRFNQKIKKLITVNFELEEKLKKCVRGSKIQAIEALLTYALDELEKNQQVLKC